MRDLQAIIEVLTMVPKGPWAEFSEGSDYWIEQVDALGVGTGLRLTDSSRMTSPVTEFFINARRDVPEMADEITRLRRSRDAAEAMREESAKWLCIERERHVATYARLIQAIDDLREYGAHGLTCPVHLRQDRPCDCGLAEALVTPLPDKPRLPPDLGSRTPKL